MGDPGWRVRAYCILQKASERLVPRIDRWAQFAPVGRGKAAREGGRSRGSGAAAGAPGTYLG